MTTKEQIKSLGEARIAEIEAELLPLNRRREALMEELRNIRALLLIYNPSSNKPRPSAPSYPGGRPSLSGHRQHILKIMSDEAWHPVQDFYDADMTRTGEKSIQNHIYHLYQKGVITRRGKGRRHEYRLVKGAEEDALKDLGIGPGNVEANPFEKD